MVNKYYISTDKSKLNITLIHEFLDKKSYWANGRSLAAIKKSIDNSLCFGVYLNDKQVGFARVITDYAVFAYILDVFILEEHRKQGLGKLLMKKITEYPELQCLKRWGLATNDAHELYRKYGFKNLSHPEYMMEKIVKQAEK